jgi:hypothetical protein
MIRAFKSQSVNPKNTQFVFKLAIFRRTNFNEFIPVKKSMKHSDKMKTIEVNLSTSCDIYRDLRPAY